MREDVIGAAEPRTTTGPSSGGRVRNRGKKGKIDRKQLCLTETTAPLLDSPAETHLGRAFSYGRRSRIPISIPLLPHPPLEMGICTARYGNLYCFPPGQQFHRLSCNFGLSRLTTWVVHRRFSGASLSLQIPSASARVFPIRDGTARTWNSCNAHRCVRFSLFSATVRLPGSESFAMSP